MIQTLEDLGALIAGKLDGLENRLGARLDAIETRLDAAEGKLAGVEFSAERARVSAGKAETSSEQARVAAARAADIGAEVVTRIEKIERTPQVAAELRVVGGGRA
jgi:hypothetical protein